MRLPRRARRTLVLGGARSGKSRYAEQLVGRTVAVDYVACGLPPTADDPEWAARVELHRARRPAGWRTVETVELPRVLTGDGPPVLLDCLSTWLARVMDDCGIWTAAPGADRELAGAVDAAVTSWAGSGRRIVAVSSEVGSGIVPASAAGRRFRDELGVLNARFAATADRVVLVTAGLAQRLR